ncbi:MAG: hypothetical protein E7166_00360 [Firmicutes bacterium]|nr:hypothetical protein [Bacillota bacterium]
MKALLYIIGEFSIGGIIFGSIIFLSKGALKLLLSLEIDSIILGIFIIFIVVSIIFRTFMYFEQKH